jgi:hypothetical protein
MATDWAFYINSKNIDDPVQVASLRKKIHAEMQIVRPKYWFVLIRNLLALSFLIANFGWLLMSGLFFFGGSLNFLTGFVVVSNMAIVMKLIEGRSQIHEYVERLFGEWREISQAIALLGERNQILKERLDDLKKGRLSEVYWEKQFNQTSTGH